MIHKACPNEGRGFSRQTRNAPDGKMIVQTGIYNIKRAAMKPPRRISTGAELVHANGCLRRNAAPGFDAADSVPGISGVGLFALAFVALEEAGDEQLFG